jgi:hypothetical protein
MSVVINYEIEPNKLVCFKNCVPVDLEYVGGVYRYAFRHAIITSSIRIVLAKWTG